MSSVSTDLTQISGRRQARCSRDRSPSGGGAWDGSGQAYRTSWRRAQSGVRYRGRPSRGGGPKVTVTAAGPPPVVRPRCRRRGRARRNRREGKPAGEHKPGEKRPQEQRKGERRENASKQEKQGGEPNGAQ